MAGDSGKLKKGNALQFDATLVLCTRPKRKNDKEHKYNAI